MKNLRSFYDVLFGNLVVIILIASGITLYSMFTNLGLTVRSMSTGMIEDRLFLAEQELQNIFGPIESHLKTTKSRAKRGVFDDFKDNTLLDAYFVSILRNSTSISSILIANEFGDEYMLLAGDSVWVTRITEKGSKNQHPMTYSWIEQEKEPVIVDRHTIEKKYDPRTRPWYQLALKTTSDTVISWTDPYTFFTTQHPGITASIQWTDPSTDVKYVAAIDVLISDLSEFTTTIDITENGKVFILSEDLKVVGLPRDDRFLDKEIRNEYALKRVVDLDIPLLNQAAQIYREANDTVKITSFKFENEIWWTGVDLFALSQDKKLMIGVIVPETDFSADIEGTRRLIIGGLFLTILFFLIILYSFFKMKRANKIIAIERDKNEQLLLNTLPIKVVNDLKVNGKSDPQKFKNVTVSFADIVGFTQISSQLDPKQLIDELNDIYTAFDEIMIKYDCERIKTMGDAYLSVCGMPQKNEKHAEMMLRSSVEIIEYIRERNHSSKLEWKLRIGMHSGNVVGGIVGVKKYIYDVFGDTINTASRMESNSQPMHVNLSEETYIILKDSDFVKEKKITFEKREPIVVKGKGLMNMYFAHISTFAIRLSKRVPICTGIWFNY